LGRLIQEYVERSLPNIGRKPSFHFPFIIHLYQQYGCINETEDTLIIVEDEVVYKLGLEIEITEAETKESSEDPVLSKPPLSVSGDRSWEGPSAAKECEEEVTPSPNMKNFFYSVVGATTFDPRRTRCFHHQRVRKST
jgi:hypothetical protein